MKFREAKKHKPFKHFSLLVVSDDPSVKPKSRRMSLKKIYILISSYSLVCAFVGFLIFSVSPLNKIIFPVKEISNSDRKMIMEFNNRMINLNIELEKMRNTNLRLRRLADTSVKKTGGNIYTVILDFFDKFVLKQGENPENTFLSPVSGYISRSFLPEKGHMGVDYVLKTGTPVYSAGTGYVIFSDYTSKDGYMIIIAHPENYISIYKHCSLLIKKERDKVLQGELIALSGSTGEVSTGPHLHLEIWKNGKPIDPLMVLTNK